MKKHLIAVDSDGCAIDVMERKHRKCFTPATIECWGLEPIREAVVEVAEKVNLRSDRRGINRFPGLVLSFDLLANHPAVLAAGFPLPDIGPLRALVADGVQSLEQIKRIAAATHCPVLQRVVEWSHTVNEKVAQKIHATAFESVRETLAEASVDCDCVVVSSANLLTIRHEWESCGLSPYVSDFFGQEAGSKSDILGELIACGYHPENTIMVGDAPGDQSAAKANRCLFFPILPGDEAGSWRRLLSSGLEAFLAGSYRDDLQASLVAEFEERLPPLGTSRNLTHEV